MMKYTIYKQPSPSHLYRDPMGGDHSAIQRKDVPIRPHVLQSDRPVHERSLGLGP